MQAIAESISAINEHVLTLLIQPTPKAVQKAVTIIILICILRCTPVCNIS